MHNNYLKEEKLMAQFAEKRAGLYNLLVGVFGPLPDKNLISLTNSKQFKNLISNYSKVNNEKIITGIKSIQEFIKESTCKTTEVLLEEIGVDRTKLLRVPGKTKLKPPYEALYKEDSLESTVLKVKSFYRKVGFLPKETTKDAPDFICIELDFMNKLCNLEKEQWLLDNDAIKTLLLEEEFLREHLSSWISKYCTDAYKYANTNFYRGFLLFLYGFIESDFDFVTKLLKH